MIRALIAASTLALGVGASSAAPVNVGAGVAPPQSPIVKVHGNHQDCRRGPRGWHRHTWEGKRRPCRVWRGEGKRPDLCIKLGPIWYCDY